MTGHENPRVQFPPRWTIYLHFFSVLWVDLSISTTQRCLGHVFAAPLSPFYLWDNSLLGSKTNQNSSTYWGLIHCWYYLINSSPDLLRNLEFEGHWVVLTTFHVLFCMFTICTSLGRQTQLGLLNFGKYLPVSSFFSWIPMTSRCPCVWAAKEKAVGGWRGRATCLKIVSIKYFFLVYCCF